LREYFPENIAAIIDSYSTCDINYLSVLKEYFPQEIASIINDYCQEKTFYLLHFDTTELRKSIDLNTSGMCLRNYYCPIKIKIEHKPTNIKFRATIFNFNILMINEGMAAFRYNHEMNK